MKRTLTLITLLAASGAAQAALIDRGGGLLYDTVLNITWLQDANYAKTSGYDADGRMTWDEAMTWAANLTYFDTVRGVTYDDWRLPKVLDTGSPGCDYAFSGTDCGYNVQTYDSVTGTVYSELAYMYYVNLGLKVVYNPDGSINPNWGIFGNGTCNGTDCDSYGQADVGLVKNLQSYVYWSGTEYALDTNSAWAFFIPFNGQYYTGKSIDSNNFYAWAVRDGDVAAVRSVPEPQTLGLLALGLLGLGLARWCR